MKLKQKITGIVVLTSMSMIFLPMLLNEKPSQKIVMENLTLKKPVTTVQTVDLAAFTNSLDELIDVNLATKKVLVPTDNTSEPEQQEMIRSVSSITKNIFVAVVEQKVDMKQQQKWIVQAGSYKRRVNASFFKEKLLAKKYPTLIEEVETKSGLHYRIRLGPMDDYDLAKQLSARLEKDFKVKGWVAKY